ncbi:hypothetical protein CEXT_744351 [Caerostris extrusa]|uniref:Uncharacterized protein n=1 Tax=Caerostris extrusa TaxID=172846 RepID=A0AAV4UM85_CAEEX|nr:hypothetical protein CEXT_744351 [Caerostris extrusa]
MGGGERMRCHGYRQSCLWPLSGVVKKAWRIRRVNISLADFLRRKKRWPFLAKNLPGIALFCSDLYCKHVLL